MFELRNHAESLNHSLNLKMNQYDFESRRAESSTYLSFWSDEPLHVAIHFIPQALLTFLGMQCKISSVEDCIETPESKFARPQAAVVIRV